MNRNRRVLVITTWYPHARNPLEGTFVADQADALGKAGTLVSVIHVPPIPLLPGIVNQARFYLPKPKMRPDVIHAHGTLFAGVRARSLSRSIGVPYVVTEHACPFSIQTDKYWKRGWAREVLMDAHAVIAVSDKLRQEMQSFAGVSVEVVPNLVPEVFYQLPERPPGPGVLFVGQGHRKGADLIPAVVESLSGRPRSEIVEAMDRASLVLCPSRDESFGMVAAEAIAAGKVLFVAEGHPLARYADRVLPLDRESWRRAVDGYRASPFRTSRARLKSFSADAVVPEIERVYDLATQRFTERSPDLVAMQQGFA
jgi:glycosyltransferase involved in cell wall biosynthesis